MISESKTPTKKRLRVVAAVIRKNNTIFCAQRDYGFLKGKWEFPGGKIEAGETPETALIREIKEELDTAIIIDGFFMNVVYEYPEFILDMDVFDAHVQEGRLEIEKGIHSAEAWLSVATLQEEDWCPADAKIVAKIKERN
jgi:8-oxo-dGTP diphosphatase